MEVENFSQNQVMTQLILGGQLTKHQTILNIITMRFPKITLRDLEWALKKIKKNPPKAEPVDCVTASRQVKAGFESV